MRRKHQRTTRTETSNRVNRRIRASEIRVIDPDGEQLGVMTPDEGREKAEERGLDLVEVAPQASPPVCRIMDYGKFQYDQSKKASASKSQRVQMKTIQLRPNTDDHDMNTKLKRAQRFVDDGNQVKFVMRMRGRERAYTQRWIDQLGEIITDFAEESERDINVVARPRGEGWRIHAIIEPG
ncbi:MAG: translation initiation factor IF-3 [Bradymonadaceae bacterium]